VPYASLRYAKARPLASELFSAFFPPPKDMPFLSPNGGRCALYSFYVIVEMHESIAAPGPLPSPLRCAHRMLLLLPRSLLASLNRTMVQLSSFLSCSMLNFSYSTAFSPLRPFYARPFNYIGGEGGATIGPSLFPFSVPCLLPVPPPPPPRPLMSNSWSAMISFFPGQAVPFPFQPGT